MAPSSSSGASICMALALLACALPAASIAAAAAAAKGSTVFFSHESNTLLVTSPSGVTTAKVQLASTKRQAPGIRLTSAPAAEMRRTFVLPGTASGHLAFNPANVNSPPDANVANDKPQIIVTNLATGKVAATAAVPSPGVKGCNFFSSDVVAHGGNLAVGFDNRLVTAGDLTNGRIPLWLVLRCPTQTYLAKYSYNVATKKLTYSTTKYALDAAFLGGFDPLAFVHATTNKPGGGLYAIAANFTTGKIGVFLNKGRAFTRVALIDAGSSKESPCSSFVLTDPAKRVLTAFCGNELAQLTEENGYVGIPGTEFIYFSSIAAGGKSSIMAVSEPITGASASVYQIKAHTDGPSDVNFKFQLPSTKYAGSIIVVN